MEVVTAIRTLLPPRKNADEMKALARHKAFIANIQSCVTIYKILLFTLFTKRARCLFIYIFNT